MHAVRRQRCPTVYRSRESDLEQPGELSANFVLPKERLCFTKGNSLFYQRNSFVLPKETSLFYQRNHLCFTKGTTLFNQRKHLCFTKGTSLLYQSNIFVLPKEPLCFTKGTSLSHQRNILVLQKELLCFTKGTSLFYKRKTSPRLGAHRNRLQPRGNGERCRCWRRFISTGTVAMINCDDERDDDHHHHHDRIVCNTDCTIVIADQT